mgnify:CR=1 FL=1
MNEKIDFTDCPCFSGKAYSGAKGKKDLYERYVSARYDLILRPAYEMVMVQSQDDGWTMSELQ